MNASLASDDNSDIDDTVPLGRVNSIQLQFTNISSNCPVYDKLHDLQDCVQARPGGFSAYVPSKSLSVVLSTTEAMSPFWRREHVIALSFSTRYGIEQLRSAELFNVPKGTAEQLLCTAMLIVNDAVAVRQIAISTALFFCKLLLLLRMQIIIGCST